MIETNRLILRPICPSDFKDLCRMNGDPLVMKYIGDGTIRNDRQMLEEMELLISYYRKRPGLGVWVITLKTSAEFIGAGGLTYNTSRSKVELGYRLLKEQWYKGYATEAARALLEYAFKDLKSNEVIASAHADNTLSQNVLKKIGMKHVDDGFEFNSPQVYYEINAMDHSAREIRTKGFAQKSPPGTPFKTT